MKKIKFWVVAAAFFVLTTILAVGLGQGPPKTERNGDPSA